MERDKATIKGVIVHEDGMNVEAWKEEIRNRYELANKYGKSQTVDFEDVIEEDGSGYTSYWVV